MAKIILLHLFIIIILALNYCRPDDYYLNCNYCNTRCPDMEATMSCDKDDGLCLTMTNSETNEVVYKSCESPGGKAEVEKIWCNNTKKMLNCAWCDTDYCNK